MKKIIMASMLVLTVLFTGCGKSEEEKKIEREDREERLEAEAIMRMWGFDDETIEEEMELMEEEQKETRKERIEEEKQEEIERLKREEETKKEEARLEAERKAEEERLEAERLEKERIEKEKREAEERAWKEREDFMYGITSQQTSGLPCRIEWDNYYIRVYITDNETNLINSIVGDVEDTRYTQIKQNLGLWSGEMKEKYSKQFNESPIVRYYYYAGEEWFGTAEDGFVLSDYLMY